MLIVNIKHLIHKSLLFIESDDPYDDFDIMIDEKETSFWTLILKILISDTEALLNSQHDNVFISLLSEAKLKKDIKLSKKVKQYIKNLGI